MRFFLLLLVSTLSYSSNAQTTLIPDPNFEQALISLGYDSGPIDGNVLTSSISGVTSLAVGYSSISSLTGIEDFTSLTYLDCRSNSITSVNFSQNTNLDTIFCQNNQLTTWNLSLNTNLLHLNCADNQLANLNVTLCPNLQTLHCYNNGYLTSLNLTQNALLLKVNCRGNQLSSLDLTQNPNLLHAEFASNQISSINLTQNPSLQYLDCSSNSSLITDVTQNLDLEHFNCYGNQLTAIDISQNTQLKFLDCHLNLLTSLDVSQNLILDYLRPSYNQLVNLDVSQNPLLTFLNFQYNDISIIDVSQNLNLEHLRCSNNLLTGLDVSQNVNLNYLYCDNNELTCLRLGSFNNSIFHTFVNNPNLFCITSDDPLVAFQNLTNKDAWATYSQNCLCNVPVNTLSGTVRGNSNNSCTSGTNMEQVMVHTDVGYYGFTDVNGVYTLFAENGMVEVHQLPPNHPMYLQQICPNTPTYHSHTFNGTGQTEDSLDFYDDVLECSLLTVSVSSNSRTRCFNNITYVDYCNDGFSDTSNVSVFVELPQHVIFQSANASYTITAEGYYEFFIGNLNAGDCGQIIIYDSVACVNGILGEMQCTRAWITPPNECLYQYQSVTPWDLSDVTVSGSCMNDTLVVYTIENTGTGNMSASTEYRLYEDGVLIYVDSVQLTSGDSLHVTIPSTGLEYRLEVDQTEGYPTISNPNSVVYACSPVGSQLACTSIRPNDDQDDDLSTDCLPIIGSYDPNDKQFSPSAIGVNNYIAPETPMDYTIRFQNTGTAPAMTVVIVDTISPLLDLSTFNLLGSSHTVVLDFIGDTIPILKFSFFNINLPDSTSNLLESQGFVRFNLSPIPGLPIGAQIFNDADIYFDFNDPIITNDSWYTLYDTVPSSVNVQNCIPNFSNDIISSCGSYTWIDGNTYTSSNSNATYTLTNSAGCDSLVTLNLTINNSASGTDVISACDAYTWIDGNIYPSSNSVATYTLATADGCDSLVTLNLTITSVDVSTSTNAETISATFAGLTYQWIDCSDSLPISGETNQFYTATINGDYAVVITDGNCSDTSTCTTINTIGITDLGTTDELVIYPNPSNDGIFVIEFSGEIESIEVHDVLGRAVNVEINDNLINGSALSSGQYLVTIMTSAKRYVQEIVVN